MKRYLSLVLMLCLLVGCGAEPTAAPDTAAAQSVGEADNATVTAEPPTATNTPRPPTDTPAFTDSGRIAFTSDRDGNKEIYVMDSSGLTRLTDNPAEDRWPAWSPDGKRIAFPCSGQGRSVTIDVMSADGSAEAHYLVIPKLDEASAWSPDGTEIAFTTTLDGNNDEIFVMSADGNGQTNLTNNPASDTGPAWSP